MAFARLLFGLLVIWLLVIDVTIAQEARPFPHPSAAIMLGLLLGEAALVATWAAVAARVRWWQRLAGGWLTAAALAAPASWFSAPSWRAWTGLLLLFMAVVVVGWKAIRTWGWRWDCETHEQPRSPRRLGPRQYSLAALLEVITATSLTLGLATWLALPAIQPHLALISIVILAGCWPLTMCVLLMDWPRWWPRVLTLGLVPLAGGIFTMLHGHQPLGTFLALVLGVELLVAALAAALLATAGQTLRFPLAARSTSGS